MPPQGFRLLAGALDAGEQDRLVALVRAALAEAPPFTPTMPRSGRPFSVAMSNMGSLGWVSDRAGYRYQEVHPVTGRPWPAIPGMVLDLWRRLAGYPHDPEACLVNMYGDAARLGLHRDEDEEDFSAPVLSISLGDAARFRIGGLDRKGATSSLTLGSGDIVLLGGAARLAYHGVDRIHPGTSRLLPEGGRINLTLRRVRKPAAIDRAVAPPAGRG